MKPVLIQGGQKYLTNGSSWILKKSESIQSKTLRFISIQMAPKHGNTVLKQQLIMRLLFLMEDGKNRIGLVHIMISPSRGFIIQILGGFISVNQQMKLLDMERKSWLDMEPCRKLSLFFSKSSEDWLYLNFEKSETGQYYDFKNKSWYNLK